MSEISKGEAGTVSEKGGSNVKGASSIVLGPCSPSFHNM